MEGTVHVCGQLHLSNRATGAESGGPTVDRSQPSKGQRGGKVEGREAGQCESDSPENLFHGALPQVKNNFIRFKWN